MVSFDEKVAAMERDLEKIGAMWVALHKKFNACPEREDNEPHVPEFGQEFGDIRCAHCGTPLVMI